MFKFKNASRLTRDRKIEGETGTEIGLPGGDTIWVLAATDANPRWEKFGDDYVNELGRLQRAKASVERVRRFQAEWFTRMFMLRWDVKGEDGEPVPFTTEASEEYLMLDDVIPAIQGVVFNVQNFRGARIETVVREGKGLSSGVPNTEPMPSTGSV